MAHRSQAAIPRPSVTNSLTFRITMLVIGLFLRMVSVAERTDNIVPFKSPHRSMIVVEVRVNGKGPYPFLFDTGATSSAVDPKLFSALHLPTARSVEVASWEATTDARRALVESLSFGPVNSGRLSVLVQPLSEFKAIDPDVRGVLGADVLLCSNFLIDNRTHHIQFDVDGTLLAQLSGDRIAMAPIRTRTGDLESRLISVPVQMDKNAEPLHMLLDTAADMVVLQPSAGPQPTVPRGTKWISDQNGKLSSATTFHTRLSVGSEVFSTEVWVGDAGLKQIVIDGLLPTGGFSQLYIANHGSFVIFEPRRIAAKPGRVEKRLLVPASSLGSTD
ncbi:MAG TPA: retropepsin-like aspartic protease [Bryocella sp.]|nr:retropepsin-like aspartic protease [Bryocella sp.]